jgi:hypothetical protein
MKLGVIIKFWTKFQDFIKPQMILNKFQKFLACILLPWILIRNWIRIWESHNVKGCSTLPTLLPSILFQIFWTKESQFWSKSISVHFLNQFQILNLRPSPLVRPHLPILLGSRMPDGPPVRSHLSSPQHSGPGRQPLFFSSISLSRTARCFGLHR